MYKGNGDEDAQERYDKMEAALLELEKADGRVSVLYRKKLLNSSTLSYWRASYPEFKDRWDMIARNQYRQAARSPRPYGEKKSPEMFEAVLTCLRRGKSITYAARDLGLSRGTINKWRQEDEDFSLACELAIAEGVESLEDEAHRRANDGVLKPVFQQGEQIGVIREYSDTLMQLLLKAKAPDKYKEFKQVHNHFSMSGAVAVVPTTPVELSNLSTNDLAKLYRETVRLTSGDGPPSGADSSRNGDV